MIDSTTQGRMAEFLHATLEQLSSWLTHTLSQLDDAWWDSLVLTKLSFQQQQRVNTRGIDSLDDLDLAALLRILDQNWYQISQVKKFSQQERHYVKEMQSIRNRWAHIDAKGMEADDTYRDMDTIQRFISVIDGPDELLTTIRASKASVLASGAQTKAQSEPAERPDPQSISDSTDLQTTPDGKIHEKSIIRLKSDPDRQGVVLAIEGHGDSARCTVFIDGKTQHFYLSQIELAEVGDAEPTLTVKGVRNLLTCLQIRHPSISTLYSLNAARIDFVPYQFRPALKVIHSDRPRLLIADGVGVGKTIEAGLVLRELQARHMIESVLIICPKPLVAERKWELEMKRFDERFTQLDGPALRYCLDETDLEGEWPDQHAKTIIPYSLFDEKFLLGDKEGRKGRIGLLQLDPPPRFDLVIVDEAHHVRNSLTFAHQAVRTFCENAEAALFLTATPIQLGNRDLFTLLNLLRPDVVIDEETFRHMAEPNPHINKALSLVRSGSSGWEQETAVELDTAAGTAWGTAILKPNPRYQEIRRLLNAKIEDRAIRVGLIRDIEGFHSFARILNRTRRRDIEDFCVRKPQTIEVSFTAPQKELHDQLLEFEAEALALLHGSMNVKFMMSMIMRQAASCIFGLAPFVDDLLNRRLSEIALLAASEDLLLDVEFLNELRARAGVIQNSAAALPSEDPKYDALRSLAGEKQQEDNNKLMLFSTFRHTLAYLKKRLVSDGFRVEVIHGGIADEERLRIRSSFEAPKEAKDTLDIVLFSEVGCEGLDYQFCDAMVNYDLPWNPMKIEQRIGRIDRRGQKSEAVAIFNFITSGTVDADIYERCLLRIGIFEQSIGENEEILGDIYSEIRSIGENLTLTADERRAKLEQLADNEIGKLKEQQLLEDREHEFFGIRLPNSSADDEIRESESYWLSERALQSFCGQYIAKRVGGTGHITGEDLLKTLRLSREARQALLEDFRKLPRNKAPMHRSWELWLKGDDQHCSLTFTSACASDNRTAHFVMPLHPLVLQAGAFFESEHPVRVNVQFQDTYVEAGVHPFAIYAWEHKGLREELQLVSVAEDPSVRNSLFEYLESAIDYGGDVNPLEKLILQRLDAVHHGMWADAKDVHMRRNAEMCAYRRESLTTSHCARIRVIEDQIDAASNEKIRTMKTAQLRNAESDYENMLKELDNAALASDILARPIVFGVIHIEN